MYAEDESTWTIKNKSQRGEYECKNSEGRRMSVRMVRVMRMSVRMVRG